MTSRDAAGSRHLIAGDDRKAGRRDDAPDDARGNVRGPGSRGPDDRGAPAAVRGIDLRRLPIGPEEAFVLSRVDGQSSAADVAAAAGLDLDRVAAILARLEELGAVHFPSPPLPASPAFSGAPSAPVAAGGSPSGGAADPGPGAPAGATAADGIELAPDRRELIDALCAQLGVFDHYEMLGVPRTADKQALKDAYYRAVGLFHPDKYFRKELGPYKGKLDKLLQRVTEAHDVLARNKSRAEYDQYLSVRAATRAFDGLATEQGRSAALAHIRAQVEAQARVASTSAAPLTEELGAEPSDLEAAVLHSNPPPSAAAEAWRSGSLAAGPGSVRPRVPTTPGTPAPAGLGAPGVPAFAAVASPGPPLGPTSSGTSEGSPHPSTATLPRTERPSVPPGPPPGPLSDDARRQMLARKITASKPTPQARPGVGSARAAGYPPPTAARPFSSAGAPSGRTAPGPAGAGSPPLTETQRVAREHVAGEMRRRYEFRKRQLEQDRIARLVLDGEQSAAQGDFVAAANAFRLLVTMLPGDADLIARLREIEQKAAEKLAGKYLEQAEYEEKNGQHVEAARSYEKAALGRRSPHLYEKAALEYLKSPETLKNASVAARKAVELAPSRAQYRITLANAYARAGMIQSALSELERAAALDPNDASIKQAVKKIERGEQQG